MTNVSFVGTPTLVAATPSNSMSVTGTWTTGTGAQTRTAGNLLIAAVTAYGTGTAVLGTAPTGWTLVSAILSQSNAITAHYTKVATGTDAAPTFTATCTGTSTEASLQVVLYVAQDSGGGTPVLVTTGFARGSSGTLTVASDVAVPSAGCVAIASTICANGTTAGTTTWTTPSGWTLGADQLTSLVSQMATFYNTAPTSGSVLSAAIVHSRTSSNQDACILVVAPSGTSVGPMVVQHGAATGAAVPSITTKFAAPTNAGDCLFAAVSTPVNDATVSTVKLGTSVDNWAAQVSQNNGTNSVASIWADPNCAGGQTAIAITLSISDSPSVDTFEVTGLAASSPLDKSSIGSANGTGAAWSSGATATTAQASEFILGSMSGFNNITPAATPTVTGPTGWSNQVTLDAATGLFQISGYQIASATGAFTYSGTSSMVSPNNFYTAMAATFKAAPPPAGSLTVTATPGTGANGALLRVLVLTGATEAGGASGTAAPGNGEVLVTPNHNNSFIAFSDADYFGAHAFTAAASNLVLDNVAATVGYELASGYYTGTVTAGTQVTVGGTTSDSTGTASSGNGCLAAAYEIPASGGSTPVVDPSSRTSVSEVSGLGALTTGFFLPPPGSVLVAICSAANFPTGAWTITDSNGLTWTKRVDNSDGQVIFTATVPGMTVTFTGSGGFGGTGVNAAIPKLRVLLFKNAAAPASQTGGKNAAGSTYQTAVSVAATGSAVVGSVLAGPSSTSLLADTLSTMLDNIQDTTNNVVHGSFISTALTSSIGSQIYGSSTTFASDGVVAAAEIKASGGTLTRDTSNEPAVVSSTTANLVTSPGFAPTPGDLVVALADGLCTGGSVTDSSGMAWTTVEQLGTDGYAGIFIAQVSGGAGPTLIPSLFAAFLF